MFELLRISIFSTLFFVFLFQFTFVSRKIVELIKNIKEIEELTYFSFMIREDVLKAKNVSLDRNKIQLLGFMMSLSDQENDSQWGIIKTCQDGEAHIFNLNPPSQIFVLGEDGSIITKSVLAKTKIKAGEFLVYFADCNFVYEGNLVFSDLYKVSWYSQVGKIYREVERYYDGKVSKSKFFVGKGEIKTEDGKIIKISKGENEITFSVK
jgi:hypothetical protein